MNNRARANSSFLSLKRYFKDGKRKKMGNISNKNFKRNEILKLPIEIEF